MAVGWCYDMQFDEASRKGQALGELVDAAVDPATRDFNLDVCAAGELDAETLGSLLGTPPMMAERRAVVVRERGEQLNDLAIAAAGDELPQPDTRTARATIKRDRRFIRPTPFPTDTISRTSGSGRTRASGDPRRRRSPAADTSCRLNC